MKLLLIDVNCKNSSTGTIVYNLYKYVNSMGDTAAICYGRGPRVHEKNIYKFGIDLETFFHALLTRITGFTGCFSYFSTKRLIKYISEFKPDLVHIHELHAYFVNIKPLINYLKNNHIKTVMTLHCEFAYTGKCGYSKDCEKWKSECKNCKYLHDYVSTCFFDRTNYMFNEKKELFKNFDNLTIVTPSKWLADRVKQSLLKKHNIKIIHNGIDTNIFYPRDTRNIKNELNIKCDEKVVLALAPKIMSDNKGGKYILKIAEILKNQKIKFIIVGASKDRFYSDNIIIKKAIYDKNIIANYYSLADVFVICSQYENFPTTCLEAQACGTPIFGFDVGGIKETIINHNSYLTDLNNYFDLAAKIKDRLKSNYNNCAYQCTSISLDTFLTNYYNLYKS